MIGVEAAGTPSSSQPKVPRPCGAVASATMLTCSEPYSSPIFSGVRKLVPAYAASIPRPRSSSAAWPQDSWTCRAIWVGSMITDPAQMALQVHESCGHAVELDRVLGMEAAYAGTSFLTPDRLGMSYGSDQVNIVADATSPTGLGTFGWDDEGVPASVTPLVTEGRFVDYLSSREI